MPVEIADMIIPGNAGAFTVGSKEPVSGVNDLAEVHRALIEGPVTATLATINEDGTPQLTPVWVNHDGEYINLNSMRGRLKDRNIRARPHVSILFINDDNPYHWINVEGEVVKIVDEDDGESGELATQNIDDLAELYLGQRPYPLRDDSVNEVRVLYKVQPKRIVTFGPVE